MTDDDALRVLRDMPAWAEVQDADPAKTARIEAAVGQLEQLDDAGLRRVVARYVDDERRAHGELGVPAASRLYVLARYVFAAPAHVVTTAATAMRFGAFHGVPNGKGWVDEQWPWSEHAGKLRLTARFAGYFGDEYLALEEFDAFCQRFGRRSRVHHDR